MRQFLTRTYITRDRYRFTLTPDATFLVWRKDFLLAAPLYSGVVQVMVRQSQPEF